MNTTAHIDGSGGPGDNSHRRNAERSSPPKRGSAAAGNQTLVLGQVVSTDDLTYLWLRGAQKPGYSWTVLPIPPFSGNGDWSPADWQATAFGQDIIQHAQARASEVLVMDPEATYLDAVSLMMSPAGRRVPIRMRGEAYNRVTGQSAEGRTSDWIDVARGARREWPGSLQRIAEALVCIAIAPAAFLLALMTAGAIRVIEGRFSVQRGMYAGLHGRLFAGITLGADKAYGNSDDGTILIDFAARKPTAETNANSARWRHRWWLSQIPLLANVLRGEMALFGPPPIPMEQALTLTGDDLDALKVKPGLIGGPG